MMHRRNFIALSAAAVVADPAAQVASSISGGLTARGDVFDTSGDLGFDSWRADFYARAVAAGWKPDLLKRELSGLSPDPKVQALDGKQPEFSRPVSAYVQDAISDQRVATGKAKAAGLPFFSHVEDRFGVPREILIAVWAMESAFGKIQGTMDVVRSLATLAAAGRRRAWAEGEIYAALKMIASGEVTRAQLKGSWAGAMGQTQFIPTSYLSTAVDEDGDGKRDIWTSDADALASAASLLAKGGWVRGGAWAVEVILPPRFDHSLAETEKRRPSGWEQAGVRRADGRAWTGVDAASDAQLLLPSGATGPAFLVLPNHFAIRKYNNSIAYALGVGLLADRIAGGGALVTPWPRETPLSLADRQAAQSALTQLGYDPGAPDGVIGTGTRAALRQWQKTQGLPADGYLSLDMVRRLQAAVTAPAAAPPMI
jgi:membrane-bound lytic murein transglycosylase B